MCVNYGPHFIFNGGKGRELEGERASSSDGLPAAGTHRSVPLVRPRGGTEGLYLGLSVLEASEARFIQGKLD